MDTLSLESLDWAITHIRKFGDTDLLPMPFEYSAIQQGWTKLREEISSINIENYNGRSSRRFLIPKQHGGYRVAVQLDPIDTIVYTALAYECAELIENFRIPISEKVSCSYRVEIGSNGELFKKNHGWDDFHNKSQELAHSKTYPFVVTADIADFYNQISHHRIRNSLEAANIDRYRAKNIENLLMEFTGGQSRGIPIGPMASIIFAEAGLSDVDVFLLRKGYIHTRYVDDFRVFCKSIQEAYKAIHDLAEYLYTAHRLTLQANKTDIFEIGEFISDKLIDPEELEFTTKQQKLQFLKDSAPEYTEFDEYDEDDDHDEEEIEQLVRDNLVELFEASLEEEPFQLGIVKYLLRRATSLRTGVLRMKILNSIDILSPVLREVSQYLIATTKRDSSSKAIGQKFISSCTNSPQSFLPFIREWLLYVLRSRMDTSLEQEICHLCEQFRPNLGVRPFALMAYQKSYFDWVREQKETFLNNGPWDKRAIIWSCQALSRDERIHWIRRVQNTGDILDKVIAEAVLQRCN